MKITKREPVFIGNYLRLVNKYFQSGSGEEGIWETVERTNIHNSGAVVIVALNKKREVILERNWRIALESFVIQFPAGLTDREEESEEETARRELLEETGYLANKLILIMRAPASPALTPTQISHFLAPDVTFVGTRNKNTSEEIEVLRAFRDEVLLESTVGSQLVEWYYQTSPPVADFIVENSLLRASVREVLVDPVSSLVEATEVIWGK